MGGCMSCLEPVAVGDYHPHRLQALFGTNRLPDIDVELAKLPTLALAMVGHTSSSGGQRKISRRLATDRATLQLAKRGLPPHPRRARALLVRRP